MIFQAPYFVQLSGIASLFRKTLVEMWLITQLNRLNFRAEWFHLVTPALFYWSLISTRNV